MRVMLIIGLLLQMSVVLALVVWMGKRRHVNGPRAVVRSASLRQPETLGWWMGMLSALLPMMAAATFLVLRWATIPQRFPIHWGSSGTANGWAQRSVGSVFGLLAAGVVGVLVMAVLGEMTAQSSPGFTGREKLLGLVRTILLAAAWMVSGMNSGISLLPLAADPSAWMPVLLVACMAGSLGLLVFVAYRAVRMGNVMEAAQATTEGRYWKAGVFYVNPADSALFVPKRMGLGYTLNFGRPVAWVVMGLIAAVPLATVALSLGHRRH